MDKQLAERDHYYPILIALKAAGGKSEISYLKESVAALLRADLSYRNTASGPKTAESQFEKDFNWAGKRLGDAGLLNKLRTHWELSESAKALSIIELLKRSTDVG
jgi:hypothetical protein